MIYKFEPHYFERVWGGRSFELVLGRKIPESINIGESWDIVDRPDFQSILSDPHDDKITIRELIKSKHPQILGPGWQHDQPFPILIKWLDCKERLSLQVHPPSKLAKLLNGEPKTENWYIAHAQDEAGLFIGLKQGKTREDFIQALEEENLESVCHHIKSKPGDSILVESGRMHAIDAGNLILEIQQNSDTTFRVYDWGRKGINGQPRQLHIKESLQCIDFNDFEPKVMENEQSSYQKLADCEHFRIRKYKAERNQTLKLKNAHQQCIILNPINVAVSVGSTPINAGELGLSPFDEECVVTFLGSGDLLVTDNFYNPTPKTD